MFSLTATLAGKCAAAHKRDVTTETAEQTVNKNRATEQHCGGRAAQLVNEEAVKAIKMTWVALHRWNYRWMPIIAG